MPPLHVNVEEDFSASREGFMITIHGKPIPKKRSNPIRHYNPSKAASTRIVHFPSQSFVWLAWCGAFDREFLKG